MNNGIDVWVRKALSSPSFSKSEEAECGSLNACKVTRMSLGYEAHVRSVEYLCDGNGGCPYHARFHGQCIPATALYSGNGSGSNPGKH